MNLKKSKIIIKDVIDINDPDILVILNKKGKQE